jgi:hypothetical protein
MPNILDIVYEKTGTQKTRHYIETGTFLGRGISSVLNNYDTIHSIELSEKWYNYNVEQFKDHSHVKMYHGDSKQVLPMLLETIQEPVTIYLDAHYSGGQTEFGEEETPLLYELAILKERKFDDIIIIDDCRLLGNTGICGAGPDHPIYPNMVYDWRDVTEEKIVAQMKEGYFLLKNVGHQYTDGAEDQIILIKTGYLI